MAQSAYDVYNIEVSENHNSFAARILTHRCECFDKIGQAVGTREAEALSVVPAAVLGAEAPGEAAFAAAQRGVFATRVATGNLLYETGNWSYNKIFWGILGWRVRMMVRKARGLRRRRDIPLWLNRINE